MSEIIERCRKAGIRLWVEGDALRCDAPKGAVTPDLLAELKGHKATVMAELGKPWKPPRRGLGGYNTPPGAAPLRDTVMARQARGYEDPGPSIGASMARLSDRDLDDMARATMVDHPAQGGDLPPAEAEAIRELFVATGRILCGLAVMSRSEAVLEAGRIAGALARNRRYRWTSLRTALEGYPELLARVPDRDGVVDSLVFGLATVAVLKDRHVLRQGEFAGAQEAQT